MENQHTFPPDNLDPRKKGKEWILQYIKAAYSVARGFFPNNLYFGNVEMNEVRSYALGMPSINKFKKQKLGNEQYESTWENIDWSPIDFLSKYRNIMVAKISQRSYDIKCTPIDPLAKSEADNRFKEMKAKIAMRQAAMEMGSELADSPALKPEPNEPEDMEQLEMEMEFGYKSVLSMEAEMAIQMIQQQNNFGELRKRAIEDLVDWGAAALTNYIDENGEVKTKHIDMRQLILSPFVKRDFSDGTYWGYIEEVWLGEIAEYFDKSTLQKIGDLARGQWGNPRQFNYGQSNWYHQCKVLVFKCWFKSYNISVTEERVDASGNIRAGKTDFKYAAMAVNLNGQLATDEDTSKPKYYTKELEVVYKGSWILNSEYIYDYGLSENMNRKPLSRSNTSLDLQFYSWNYDRGMFSGMTKKMIPLQDQACLIWYKMQNLAAKLIPYIISIDMSALENVSYGKSGVANNPENITEFIFSNFTALYRSVNLLEDGNRQPMTPINIQASGQLYAFGELRNQLLMIEDMMRKISGLNEVTDASTPNAKNLNSTNQAAIESTNNALYGIQFADQQLVQQNADNAMGKLQIAVMLGKVEGYVKVMGQESLKFLEINPEISLREFGIYCQVVPSYEERQMLWQDVSMKESQGILDITDKELIMSCTNIKQAMKVLGYRIKKRKEQMQQQELQKIQANNEGQQQMIVMQAQSQQQMIEAQLQADLIRIQTQMQWTYQVEAMKKQADYEGEVVQSEARTIGHNIQSQAKQNAALIAAEASIEKAKVKPKATAKK